MVHDAEALLEVPWQSGAQNTCSKRLGGLVCGMRCSGATRVLVGDGPSLLILRNDANCQPKRGIPLPAVSMLPFARRQAASSGSARSEG